MADNIKDSEQSTPEDDQSNYSKILINLIKYGRDHIEKNAKNSRKLLLIYNSIVKGLHIVQQSRHLQGKELNDFVTLWGMTINLQKMITNNIQNVKLIDASKLHDMRAEIVNKDNKLGTAIFFIETADNIIATRESRNEIIEAYNSILHALSIIQLELDPLSTLELLIYTKLLRCGAQLYNAALYFSGELVPLGNKVSKLEPIVDDSCEYLFTNLNKKYQKFLTLKNIELLRAQREVYVDVFNVLTGKYLRDFFHNKGRWSVLIGEMTRAAKIAHHEDEKKNAYDGIIEQANNIMSKGSLEQIGEMVQFLSYLITKDHVTLSNLNSADRSLAETLTGNKFFTTRDFRHEFVPKYKVQFLERIFEAVPEMVKRIKILSLNEREIIIDSIEKSLAIYDQYAPNDKRAIAFRNKELKNITRRCVGSVNEILELARAIVEQKSESISWQKYENYYQEVYSEPVIFRDDLFEQYKDLSPSALDLRIADKCQKLCHLNGGRDGRQYALEEELVNLLNIINAVFKTGPFITEVTVNITNMSHMEGWKSFANQYHSKHLGSLRKDDIFTESFYDRILNTYLDALKKTRDIDLKKQKRQIQEALKSFTDMINMNVENLEKFDDSKNSKFPPLKDALLKVIKELSANLNSLS